MPRINSFVTNAVGRYCLTPLISLLWVEWKRVLTSETIRTSDVLLHLQIKNYLILCSLQEAQKRMKIKKPPHILVIHLKRFKYIENLGRYKKLSYRVVFPLELKLTNTMEDADSEYSLFAVVVHVGTGPNHGHYVSLVKSHNHWLFFDDENVDIIDESAVQTFFGSAQEYSSNSEHGYILFYERLTSDTSWPKFWSSLLLWSVCVYCVTWAQKPQNVVQRMQ